MTTIAVESNGDEALVRAAAAGDQIAFTHIVAAHHDDMVRVAFVVCGGDATIAREATQAAWAIAWQKLHTLREADRLRPWLVSVAANEARQAIRRSRHRALFEIDIALEENVIGDGDPARLVGSIDLAEALGRLSEDDRVVIALRYVADLPSAEIAAHLRISPVGARTRLSRAMARLRRELRDG